MFEKATCSVGKISISMYGRQGSGKTFGALMLAEGLAARRGKRVAFINTETGGYDFYTKAVPERIAHPEAFDFDAVNTRSLSTCLKALESIDPDKHGVVVIDSMTHLWQESMDSYDGPKTSQGGIPLNAWGAIKAPYKAIMRYLLDSPLDFILLGREKNIFETHGGEMVMVGKGMKAEGETEYEPMICLRLEQKQAKEDSTHSTYLAYVEKDRSGLLAGRTIRNMTYADLEPVVQLLEADHTFSMESEEEAHAKDAELIEQMGDKAKAKEEKSAALYNDFMTELHQCQDLAQLGDVAGAIKKKARYMTGEHKTTLRESYKHRRDELNKLVTPEEV